MNLPKEYKLEMKKILKDCEEYKKFMSCYKNAPYKGIRINTLKISEEKFKEVFNFKIEKSKFSKNSYYIKENIDSIGNLPLHHAGAFYVQEPSATSVVTVLDPQPGEKILDLCAAPGGKSTQIAAGLKGKGLLWANDVIKNRAKVLLSNIERMGIRNAVVSSCDLDVLCGKLTYFFDKVLVDAPCSGEGMFRKNSLAINEWSLDNVKMCAKRQHEILNFAAKALKENGVMVYSTCTFSLEENEHTVYYFLKENPDFELEKIDCEFGRPAFDIDMSKAIDTKKARRILPQDGGEGHFIAKFRRKYLDYKNLNKSNYKSKKIRENNIGLKLFSELFNGHPYGKITRIGENIVILPDNLPNTAGLNVLRAGVLLAKIKNDTVIPAHSAFMAAQQSEIKSKVNFFSNSPEILAYLKGEELQVSADVKGYVGICVDGVITGYAKAVGGRLKNKYPKGLRLF